MNYPRPIGKMKYLADRSDGYMVMKDKMPGPGPGPGPPIGVMGIWWPNWGGGGPGGMAGDYS